MSDDYEPTEDVNLKKKVRDWRRATTKVVEKKEKTTKKRFKSTKDVVQSIRSKAVSDSNN